MVSSTAKCPEWLAERIVTAGGSISFAQYMDLVLNDPEHGAYSSGNLIIGKEGDFVTSPSLGSDFAYLLAVQLVGWLDQLELENVNNLPLSIIEVGPGEGDLAFELIRAITEINPSTISKIEFVLVEINDAMILRQKERLRSISSIPVRWMSLDDLKDYPKVGVILAHEVLDVFPVERIVVRNKKLLRQGVTIKEKDSGLILSFIDMPLPKLLEDSLVETFNSIDIEFPPSDALDGWSSEFHSGLDLWLEKASKSLESGCLLIIDYALEASRYYSSSKDFGTIMSYKKQSASLNVLHEPGFRDITSHLCIETVIFYAEKNKWNYLGEVRQGQALLALGLAERLHSLRNLPSQDLAIALNRRESLLRLVDPAGLGEFRWLAFRINNNYTESRPKMALSTRFLLPPN